MKYAQSGVTINEKTKKNVNIEKHKTLITYIVFLFFGVIQANFWFLDLTLSLNFIFHFTGLIFNFLDFD